MTHKEELLLVKYHIEYGSNWERIALHLPGHAPTRIQNRYYTINRKRKYKELADEVRRLEDLGIDISKLDEQNKANDIFILEETQRRL